MDYIKDDIIPEGKWKFNQEVADVFDDMLKRSIPEYDSMRSSCNELARRYRKSGTDIVDLGCSHGEAMAPLINQFGSNNLFLGIEVSLPMIEIARKRFEQEIQAGYVRIEECDLRFRYPVCKTSVTLLVLTLQFIPVTYRQSLLRSIYNQTVEGGVLIIVEKVLGNGALIDETMVECYHNLKKNQGYSDKAIQMKSLSLESVLVPLKAKWNEESLQNAGFQEVDCFWRWMNFAAWIAIK